MKASLFTTILSALVLTSLSVPNIAQAKKTDGKFTVTAKLVKIGGKFPPNDLYDYAFVMKYVVVGGKLDKKEIYVAHYKPRLRRHKISGKMKKFVHGSLHRFKEGALHRLILAPKLKKIWKGAIVDEFFAKDRKSKRYWCLQVDMAKTSK